MTSQRRQRGSRGRLMLSLALAVIAGVVAGLCMNTPNADAAAAKSLDKALASVISDAKLGAKARIGAIAIDLATGKTVYELNADTALVPASNMKLLTTAAALRELGPEFELVTELRARGEIRDGVLNGDLLLIGRGDPNISGRFHEGDIAFVLKEMAGKLAATGVTQVTGQLYFDDSYFSGERFHPEWPADQFLKWYTAEVSALTINDNCVSVIVDPAAAGKRAGVRFEPDTAAVRLASGAVDTQGNKSDPKVGWSRPRDANELRIWGTISAHRGAYRGECTLSDPAAVCAQVMQETLASADILVEGRPQRRATPREELGQWCVVADYRSRLAPTVEVCNTNSQNLYAECLLRILGAEKAGEGSFAGGSRAVCAFLKNAGLPMAGVTVSDGSGMSRENRVTPRLLVALLRSMDGCTGKQGDGPSVADAYRDSLAVAGESGTLSKRMTRAAKGRVIAKTGYLNGVGALSGYVDADSGARYAFSIIVNDYSGSARAVLDGFARILAGA